LGKRGVDSFGTEEEGDKAHLSVAAARLGVDGGDGAMAKRWRWCSVLSLFLNVKKNKVKKKRVGGGGDRREKGTRVSRCWGVALREGKGTDVVVVGVVVDGDLRLLSCSLWR
jgi:hypothetical protein